LARFVRICALKSGFRRVNLSRRSLIGLSAALFAGAAAPLRALAADRPGATGSAAPPSPGVLGGRQVTREIMEAARMPSLSAAVVQDGRLVWAEAFGWADVEAQRPATTAGRYRLASVSKVIAAAVAARLAERGVVDLDAPIGQYRPSLPPAHHATTLRQLLAHTGGIRHYVGGDHDPRRPGGAIDQRTYRNTDEALSLFINDPLVSVPGEAFNYSTFGYTLMSAVLESATRLSFPYLVEREVTRPLDLQTVGPDIIGARVPDRVRCYHRSWDTGQIGPAPLVNPAYKWAGGGLLGAAGDIARFGDALLNPGYLSMAALEETFRPVVPSREPAPVQVGLGWRIDRDPAGRLRYHHAGSIIGGRSIIMVIPEAAMSVAILSNMGDLPIDPLTPAQRLAEGFMTA
jgi:serine beta-lactamase-like protein LACTB